MRKIFLAVLLAGLGTCLAASSSDFIVEYHSTEVSILIVNGMMTVSSFVHEYDNPVSATPSSTRVETNSRRLTAEEEAGLRSVIRTNGFFNLRAAYGAPPTERHYPTSIRVVQGKKKKIVVFRSHPSYPGPCRAFKRIELYLLSLIKKSEDQ